MNKEIFNLNGFCEYTGLSRSKAIKLVQTREIKHYRNSKRLIFFKKEDIDAWLLANPVNVASNDD